MVGRDTSKTKHKIALISDITEDAHYLHYLYEGFASFEILEAKSPFLFSAFKRGVRYGHKLSSERGPATYINLF